MNKMSKTILLLAVLLHSESSFCKLIANTAKKDQPTARSRRRLIKLEKKAALCATQMDCARENKQYRTRADVRLVLPIDTQMAYPLRGGF